MSSSKPSSKKTRSWRNKNLLPAGFVKLEDKATPLKEFQDLFQLFRAIANGDLSNSHSLMDQSTMKKYKESAEEISTAASRGSALSWNETEWRSECHTPLLRFLTKAQSTFCQLFQDQAWSTLNLEEGVALLPHKPDYTVAFKVMNRSSDNSFSRIILDRLLADLHPYFDDASSAAYPFLTAESKSSFGVEYEAENQCAESSIKMLHKFRALGSEADDLPVMSVSLIGYYVNVYLACSRAMDGQVSYLLQKVWAGILVDDYMCLAFHLMLHAYLNWIKIKLQPILARKVNLRMQSQSAL